ncbi:MAG TPA: OmpA family protein [Ignavibacteriaceae bacterium]|nr:OmpA family protein [Ignavibacteriaceae bacterium]
MKIICKSFLIFFLFSISAVAQKDVEGSKDHPLIPRFPGSTIVYYNDNPNGIYEYVLGPLVKPDPQKDFKLTDVRNLEGNLTRTQYKLNESDITRVVNYYEHSLKQNGFEILALTKSDKPMETAGRNWTLAVFEDLSYKEKTNISGNKSGKDNRYYIAGHLQRLNKKLYFALVINEFNENEIYVHIDVIGSETKTERRSVLNAEEITQSINEDGHAVINGIYFDKDKADMKESSDPALEEIAKYLKQNMGVKLFVVGHTGMIGNLDFQIALSKSRAESVIKALANRFNIGADRLSPQGVGPLSPISTNQNLDGREINQRIELVLKNF